MLIAIQMRDFHGPTERYPFGHAVESFDRRLEVDVHSQPVTFPSGRRLPLSDPRSTG